MIKRIMALCALMALTVLPAVAQPVLGKGGENRKVKTEDLLAFRSAGVYDGHDVWITEGKKHVKQAVVMGMDLNPIFSIAVPNSGDFEPLASAIDDAHMSMMLVERSSRRTTVFGCLMDLSTASVADPDTLYSASYGRKDECMVWTAVSPDKTKMALVVIVKYHEDKRYTTFAAVYDQDLNRIWAREYPLETMHEMFLTDEGRIVTLGYEVEGEETRFVFNTLGLKKSETLAATVKCDPIKELHLVNVVGSHAIIMGLYHPLEMRHAERYIQGVMGMSFDVDRAELTGFTMRPFQNEDMNIFLNKHTKKIQRDQMCDHIELLGTAPASFGGVLAAGRMVRVEKTNSAGAVQVESHGFGVHVVAIDTLGTVAWVRNMRRNDSAVKHTDMMQVSLVQEGDYTCVVKSEHAKEPPIYDIAKEARDYEVGDKGNLVVYTITDEGEVNKVLIERKSGQSLVRTLTRPDGTLVLLTGSGSKTRLAELKFRR